MANKINNGIGKNTSIRTAITELFKIQYPIIQGGMIWVSGWKLAAAVSTAGGLGLIGAGSMSPELLDYHIQKIKGSCDKPFGVNLPLFNRYSDKFVDVCLKNKVKIIFTSGGSPNKYTSILKENGVKVGHVVPSAKLAQKVEKAGCDAVVAEGTEAGGHNGFEEITSINLWPCVVDSVDIPVIAAGGIIDGRGMAAAMALGASGIQIGSRFAITEESSASPRYKQAVVSAEEADTRLHFRSFMPIRALINPYVQRAIDAERSGASPEELKRIKGSKRARIGIFEGDEIEGEMEIGQAAERIRSIISAGEVVQKVIEEYDKTVSKLRA